MPSLADDLRAVLLPAANAGYIGEPVSQLAHALQAAHAAERAGGGPELVLAALLHDLGHLVAPDAPSMDGLGVVDHERIGADWLRARGAPARVADLVHAHVQAKRYLVATNPSYALSPASRGTLAFQGGPMTPAQTAAFDAHPDRAAILALRTWDEAAKNPGAVPPDLDHFLALLDGPWAATADKVETWQREHRLHAGNIGPVALAELVAAVDDLAARPETPGKCMKYFEGGEAGAGSQLCRVEDFLPHHDGLRRLLTGRPMLDLLAALVGEPMVLFKEKINFKLPGGAGFTPHQDAPAFGQFGHDFHVTLMLAVDAADQENGWLEFAPPQPRGATLPQAPDGTVHPDTAAALPWTPCPAAPGDVVLFDSYIPHRSGPNRSDRPRRALFVTYNLAAAGDVRDAYFAEKRRVFPPRVERVPGVDYGKTAGAFNLGNPIK